MGIGSWWHWVIVALVVLILFGRGKISETMGDFGKGIRSFRKGLSEEEAPPAGAKQAPPPQIASQASEPAPQAAAEAPARDGEAGSQ